MLAEDFHSPLLDGRLDGPTDDQFDSLRVTYGEYLSRLAALASKFSAGVEALDQAA
jgi:hypothetical protein